MQEKDKIIELVKDIENEELLKFLYAFLKSAITTWD